MQSRNYGITKNDTEILNSAAVTEDPLENSLEIRKSIMDLSDTLKIPLTMYYFMECSYEEIAHILEIPINTIKAQIRRGKIMLHKKLIHNKINLSSVLQ